METSRTAEVLAENVNSVRNLISKKFRFSPRLFKHRELFNNLENALKMDLVELISLLNSIHFVGGPIYAILHHPHYKENILLRAYPEPSLDGTLACRWADEHLPSGMPEEGNLLYLVIDNDSTIVLVQVSLISMGLDSFSVQLPETSHVVNQRRTKRYLSRDVAVDLIQDDFLAEGELVDFSPHGFRVQVSQDQACSLECLGLGGAIDINLHRGETVLFSGPCRPVRQAVGLKGTEIVFRVADQKPVPSEKKQLRNPRQKLVPVPTLIFEHPLIKKNLQRDAADLSTSGFCIYEELDDGLLMRDLVIPEMSIDFAGTLRLKCAAQVVYRLVEGGKGIRCGLRILDMDLDNYSRLTHILTKALDPHAHIYSVVDMDALWKFFFDTGFIYLKKFRGMLPHRDEIKETYKRLYQENPEIGRHFTYQKSGEIYGHMAMVRAYEKSWLIHHHAARAMAGKRAGFLVLKQILHYLIDLCRFPSANLDYVMCYFRPENKFPDRVYGDFTKAIGNRRVCSLDTFEYLLHPAHLSKTQMPRGYALKKCSKLDQWELTRFYSHHSGGLFLDLLYPKQKSSHESVETVYSRNGLIRKWRVYSLKCHHKLKAVLLVNQSDPGLNFSELLNSITILVIDSENLPWEVLSAAVNQLSFNYQKEKIPIFIYPDDYLNGKKIPHDTRKYLLFVLEARLIRDFALFLERKFKIGYW